MNEYAQLATLLVLILLAGFGLRRVLAAVGVAPKAAGAVSAAVAACAALFLTLFFFAMRNP